MMNGTTKKLKNAPHLSEQDKAPYSEIIALIGDKAWNAWGTGENKGKNLEWDLLKQAMQLAHNYKPLILGPTQLGELSKLKLAEDNHAIFKCCVFGELTIPQEKGLLLNLANNSQIQTLIFYDGLGQEKYNLTHKLTQLREDEKSRKDEEEIARLAETDNTPKTSPYVDYREVGEMKGLFYVTPKLDNQTGEILREVEKWICNDIQLVGEGKNSNGEYYYIFQWQNEGEKYPNIEAVPLADFGSETGWKQLKAKGLKMTQGTGLTAKLAEHFHFNGDHSTKWNVTSLTGWQNGAYLLPSGEILGEPTKPIYFTDKSGSAQGYTVSGTLESWQKEIANNVRNNYSMMLGVAVAFVAPMLSILGRDSFGVHLFAESSKGKSTTLHIANSIYGNPDKLKLSWSATAVGVKNEAAARNDGFLTLDEIGQAKDARNLESIAYDLFNETGKIQGKKEGGNREINRWKVAALSTGEKDLETQLRLQGVKVHAGQLVRLLNIPLMEAKELHQFSNNKAHADHLNEKVLEHYGAVGREWIYFLANNKETVKQVYNETRKKWIDLTENMSGQVQRVAADRFASLETALQLAKHLTQWTEEENAQAILKNFLNWKEDFGEQSKEETTIIENLLNWLLAYENKFIEYPENPHRIKPNEIAGIRVLANTSSNEQEYFFIYPKTFREITKDYPKTMVFNVLSNAGILVEPRKHEKGYEYQVKIPKSIDGRSARAYKIIPVLENESESLDS
ncbi:hypothetical protein CBE90_09700 [Pasteurella multocida]|uniref:DUF927 domain-containing protein n=1 Tax=Pasteurella multocida TaxID=747 RepID=UPI000CE8CB6F|nr:DUF927 domain-containing protein [Pasteurella multocida]MDX3898085.1 DUF927 domain-containing protein [Pasteurella multocida]MDX3956305.1 DUF927 domain-containing protein [Pasteurella multocida]MDY0578997.1 DUF927 domain-containing protein [Pasteurella multocida]MEB3472602.1 DUF927 domain-containing protein [Pasteurella multocida]MEB3486649.1 DUF927 domain-containing protein [Pasteurella multocida]